MAPRSRTRKPAFVGELVAKTFDARGNELGIYQSAFPFIEPDRADEVSPKCAAKRPAPPAGFVGRGTPSPGIRDRAEGQSFAGSAMYPSFLAQYGAAVTRLYSRESFTNLPESRTARKGPVDKLTTASRRVAPGSENFPASAAGKRARSPGGAKHGTKDTGAKTNNRKSKV